TLGLEARLTWRLDRLLFSEDEPALERIRLETKDARAKVAGRALEALFEWQRAGIELAWTDPGTRERALVELKVVEAEAALDVLTNGWFSAWRSEVSTAKRARP